jgi:thiamine biosynthesis lipoprotein
VAHALTSVTVFHAACMHADALATVLTVLGPQAGISRWHSMWLPFSHPPRCSASPGAAAQHAGMGWAFCLRWRPWTIRAACALWDAIPGN